MAFSSDAAQRGYLPPQNDQEKLLMRHVQDLCRAAQSRGIARYSAFLSDREQCLATAALNAAGCSEAFFEGGYPEAERRLLCIQPAGAWGEPPICCVKLQCSLAGAAGAPQHKDYLGSVLGLGLERECMGDILLDPDSPGTAYAFVTARTAALLEAQLCSVGRLSASARIFEGALPVRPPQRTLQTATVSSLRADAVLAAMLHCSRTQAEAVLRTGRLEINHVPVSSAHAPVYEGDVFTVRGRGRYKLQALGGKSRKDRLFIEYFQY